MTLMDPLYSLIAINSLLLKKEEKVLLDAGLFSKLCDELENYFKSLNANKEYVMQENNFMKLIITDILRTDEYTISGIALYSQTPEDVIYDVMAERNTNPSANFLRKIIALHQTVRSELYQSIMKKIIRES